MADTWTTHYKGTVEGRRVKVQTYSEGGYRVATEQGEDHDGSVSRDESSMVIVPPSPAGTPIDIDGDTIDDVRGDLAEEGFSEGAINEIVGHFPV